jgi:hypothetical protein
MSPYSQNCVSKKVQYFLKYILVLISILNIEISYAQNHGANLYSIDGVVEQLQNQYIRLEGYNGSSTYTISKVQADHEGIFHLPYSNSDFGIGFLISDDQTPFFIILNGEEVNIHGESFGHSETVKIVKGVENILFEQYAKEHPKREQMLRAWDYLEKVYSKDSLFTNREKTIEAIKDEINSIK